ncbi:MAG: hypothetical protein WCG80_17760 [Spirochaetales bacterium]
MIDTSLIQLLPPIRRARGDRLYANERHWVDLWKQSGAWLLGHRPEGAAREWKNQLDKGLAAVLPSRWTARLETHLNDLLGYGEAKGTLRLYANEESAVQALEAWGGETFTFQDAKRARWLPFSGDDPPGLGNYPKLAKSPWKGVVLPRLPAGPATAFPVILGPKLNVVGDLPPAPLVAVTEAAALVRAAVTLRRKQGDANFLAALTAVGKQFDRHASQLGFFRRSGPWFEATCEPEDYERLFTTFLEAGFVLSPDQDQESVLPPELSEGEWKAFRTAGEKFLADTGPGGS